jgi:hypothetical protein
MADLVPRRPFQDVHRVVLADPVAQQFARLVPVDQEHERSTERGEEGVALLCVFRLKLAGHQKEGVLVAKPGCRMTVKSAPMHLEFVEERDEEFRARQMHVAVDDSHPMLIDGDHQDVRIGRADVVLDQKPAARARGHGVEPRMVEFQGTRIVQPAHEAFDRRMVFGPQAEDMRTCHDFFRAGGSQSVERFVQVHHQPMQAVGPFVGDTGQPRDAGNLDIAGGLQQTRIADLGEPRGGRVAFGLVAGTDRADHFSRVIGDVVDQLRQVWCGDAAIARDMRTADQIGERYRLQSRSAALGCKFRDRPLRFARMLCSCLQRAHAYLDAIVGRQSRRDQRRQQNVGFAQFSDDLRFHTLPSRLDDRHMHRLRDLFLEPDHS